MEEGRRRWRKVEECGGVGGKWRKMEGGRKVEKSGLKWRSRRKVEGRRKVEW